MATRIEEERGENIEIVSKTFPLELGSILLKIRKPNSELRHSAGRWRVFWSYLEQRALLVRKLWYLGRCRDVHAGIYMRARVLCPGGLVLNTKGLRFVFLERLCLHICWQTSDRRIQPTTRTGG